MLERQLQAESQKAEHVFFKNQKKKMTQRKVHINGMQGDGSICIHVDINTHKV
jgi:hypothetical protein